MINEKYLMQVSHDFTYFSYYGRVSVDTFYIKMLGNTRKIWSKNK